MTAPFNVGAFVPGAPTTPRTLVRHAELLAAYADGTMFDRGDDREAYLSHFAYGPEMPAHFAANRNSVAGFAGPCGCWLLVLDIDRPDLADALADARRLVQFISRRYPGLVGDMPVWFSGGKGFHVGVELVHAPPPAVGFQHVARTFAGMLAARAGVKIDPGVYDVNHIIRLPNTRHPRTGLFKVRIEPDSLFMLDLPGILETAKRPWANDIPAADQQDPQMAADWCEAEAETARHTAARSAVRVGHSTPDARAPRYLMDLFRFGVEEGERHHTLFRCAAWLTEQGSPPTLVSALLTEAGLDVGLGPKDVERQIRCGIEHAARQRAGQGEGGAAA